SPAKGTGHGGKRSGIHAGYGSGGGRERAEGYLLYGQPAHGLHRRPRGGFGSFYLRGHVRRAGKTAESQRAQAYDHGGSGGDCQRSEGEGTVADPLFPLHGSSKMVSE